MKKRILFLIILIVSIGEAKAPDNYLAKSTAYYGNKTASNISNWACWVYENGILAHSPDGSSGGYYPRETAAAIYTDGFMWGGKIDTDGDGVADRIRVGGQNYYSATVAGHVISRGNYQDALVADPDDPDVRVYRICRDHNRISDLELIKDAAFLNEIHYTNVTDEMKQEVLDQYEQDWNEWPVHLGAPFIDKDGDAVYTAGVDEPGIKNADQVIWFVVNDFDSLVTTSMYGSKPIGFELQVTIWAYNHKYPYVGQNIYKSYKLINKSNLIVKDMYFSQWSDPDIGYAGNDFAGCDTVLNMGYAYNGNVIDSDYDAFGIAPPAAGYVLLQGPMVESPGDTAYMDFKARLDHKNLAMSSFHTFSPTATTADPEMGDYCGSLEYYNMMRGFARTYDTDNPTPVHIGNRSSNPSTLFPLSGDPVSGTGDIDGEENWFSPGDRRILVNSGPIDFAPNDDQEVIIAMVGGIGEDNLNSISEMKSNARLAQIMYEDQFRNVSSVPEIFHLTCRVFEKNVVLEWGSDLERVAEIEDYLLAGYEFEGYNVYQLPTYNSRIDQATRIATFDVINGIKVINDMRYPSEYSGYESDVPVAYGDDTGIQRYMKVDWDHINNCPLYEGSTYHFAVTSYNQNLNEDRLGLKMYESDMVVHSVKLQEELPGNKLRSYVGQSDFEIEHTEGSGEGQIFVKVIDPYAITGDDYSIRFAYDNSTNIIFNIWNESEDELLSWYNEIIQDTLIYNGASIVDGLEFKVISQEEGLKNVLQYDEDDSLADASLSLVDVGLGEQGVFFSNISGEFNQNYPTEDYDQYDIRGKDDIEFDFSDSSVAWQFSNNECLDEKVPFAMYRKENGSNEKERLFIVIHDEGYGDNTPAKGLGIWDETGYEGYLGTMAYEPIYAYVGPEPYDPAKEEAYINANDLSAAPSNTGWEIYPYDNNPGYPIFTAGTIVDYLGYGLPLGYKIIFETNKPLDIDDEFQFSTASYEPIQNDSLILEAIEKINVYPNPYYGFDGFGNNDFERKVTFTHLPERATIKIFNLAGVHINTIEHNGGQFESWYLGTYKGIRVGNGMYIAHIDMPDIGKEKILKFMIVRGTYN